MKMEVMVAGCAKCRRPEGNVAKALEELGLDIPADGIEGLEAIEARGQMRAPTLSTSTAS